LFQNRAAPSPHDQGVTAASTNPRYQSVPKVDDSSRRRGGGSSLSPASSSKPSTQSSNSRRPQNDLVNEADYGPYSHMESSTLGSRTLKGSSSDYSKSNLSYEAKPTYNINSIQSNYRKKSDPEADDYLHEGPDDPNTIKFILCSGRGCVNVFTLFILIAGLLMLFAGYPLISHFDKKPASTNGAFGIGGTNGTGQIAIIPPSLKLVDPDTPAADRKWTSPYNKDTYHLVFSDEFNVEGRTFWPGDDPFWTAVDLWYGATGDYEWYTPEQVNTTGGHLQITMDQKPMHNLNFRSGMLQSWNKFCYQGGYLEFSAILPGSPQEIGWWPGLWTMGNLARPGYLGTTDGMWPYSYGACDSGILKNQTAVGRPGYEDVSTYTKNNKEGLNWLSGMRTPGCTCNAAEHPGPNPNVGRSAPELDVVEAQIQGGSGQASQSFQLAPFDLAYDYVANAATIFDEGTTSFNTYKGGVYQEAVSAVTPIPNSAYENTGARFTTFGVEYEPDWNENGGGFITWYINGVPTWTAVGAVMPADPNIDVSQRIIPVEPMTIIMNLGLSRGFQSDLDFTTLTFPATMKIDYVRVFQNDNTPADLVSCDPLDHPTSAYINQYEEVYNNVNHTTWPNPVPKNRLTGC
jgi:beta-glucanase (GH16 family)